MELPVDEMDISLFNVSTCVLVKNSRKASFWNSSWMKGTTLSSLFALLYSHSKSKNLTVAAAMEDDHWIADIDHNLTAPLIDDFVNLFTMLREAELNLNTEDLDSITWRYTANSEYSSRLAYLLQFEGAMCSDMGSYVWNIKVVPRCKFFMWLLLRDRLWTAARLQ